MIDLYFELCVLLIYTDVILLSKPNGNYCHKYIYALQHLYTHFLITLWFLRQFKVLLDQKQILHISQDFIFWSVIHIFRAQEPKAPVTYCDHALSGVRPSSVKLFTFSTSSPEPLDGFWWNLVWMKYSRSLTSVVVFRPDPSRGGSRAGQK